MYFVNVYIFIVVGTIKIESVGLRKQSGWYGIQKGTIKIESAELRKQSGWYGIQPDGRKKRLDRHIARDKLAKKAGCTKEDINGSGIYILVHKATNQAYVGQATDIGERLLQHICAATSTRKLVGKFDPFLKDNINIDEWELQIKPCEQKDLDKLECHWYNEMKDKCDMLNVKTL